jgi:plasmid stabilization system protein ParE
MTCSVLTQRRFEDDYDDILFYYKVKIGMSGAAASFAAAIDEAIGDIRRFPEIRAVSRKPGLASRQVREYLVRNHAIYYRVEGNNVVLLRLLHQSQDTSRAIIE